MVHISFKAMDRHPKKCLSRVVLGCLWDSERTVTRAIEQRRQWSMAFLVSFAFQWQVACAVGLFELQIRQWQNPLGLLQNGKCCDLLPSGGQGCSLTDQCDTFFRACLKEYQVRVAPSGICTFGTGSTDVLGGNTHTLHHHGPEGAAKGEGTGGHISIPIKYAWPKSFSLVIEVYDHDNNTSQPGSEELIERVPMSSMLNPGEQWQDFRHHGRQLSLEYSLRFHCDSNYYGPLCNHFCRARDDFFGHFECDAAGTKVCKEGWAGPECRHAMCKQGCNLEHGSCSLPGECECHYGWKGPQCDECETFPGCVHGSCSEPWKCVCDTNWGGLLCDKDLNYCGNHLPCRNGGTCLNTEPDEYQCECLEGFGGRSCEIVEHACLSSPCMNRAACVEVPSGFSCLCADGWTGHTCTDAVLRCASGPCGRGATCQETPQGFQCLCPPGWTGRTCQIDTNECEMGVCVNARSCRNLIGGYLCDCLPGWAGPKCDIRNSSCPGSCGNGGYCEGSRCVCPPGFSGRHCQTVLNLCDSAPCLHGGQCVKQEGRSVLCRCPLGYTGAYCEVQMDLCNPNPCPKGVLCQSTEGSYICACADGFSRRECVSQTEPCHGPHCRAVTRTDGGGVSVYVVSVCVLVVLVAGFCVCVLLTSRLQCRRATKQQLQGSAPEQPSINNQREFCTHVRNMDPLLPASAPPCPPSTHTALPPSILQSEEIELTVPPSPTPSHNSPALKPNHMAKLDICNLQREKLNRFHNAEHQELQV